MQFFAGGETRERHAYIDITLERLHDALSVPELRRALGFMATDYDAIADRLFVPNIHHGVLQMPSQRFADGIPIMAMKPHETVTVPPEVALTMTDAQKHHASRALKWLGRPMEDLAVTPTDQDKLDLHLPLNGLAATHHIRKVVGHDDDPAGPPLTVDQRPFVVMNYAGSGSFTNVPALLHEGRHIEQATTGCVQQISDTTHTERVVRDELDALRFQSETGGVLTESWTLNRHEWGTVARGMEQVLHYEAIGAATLPRVPDHLNPAIHAALRADGVNI